jgi:hypothetical protein
MTGFNLNISHFVVYCIVLLFVIIPRNSLIFLGAFAKLRKAIISFGWSVCPSLCPNGTTRLQMNGFSWNLMFDIFQKSDDKIQVSLKSDKFNGYFTWRTTHIFLLYLAQFFLEWEMFQAKVVEKIKTFISSSFFFFFSKIVPFVR